MKILSQEANIGIATTVSSATAVRVYNSNSSAGVVTRTDSDDNVIGNFTVPAGEVLYLQKKSTDKLIAPSTVLASKVAYSHMMSYSSYASSGGGGSGFITSNLVLHLDASNSSSYPGSGTTWTDLTGNGNNGTLVNGVSYSSSDGGYLDFDGTNDLVTFSYVTPAQTTSTSFTWFIWVYPKETNTNDVIMGNRNSASWIKLTPTQFEYYNDNFGPAVTQNQWQNICVTKNGTSFTYYKNGSSVATQTSSISKSSNPFFIGGDPAYLEYAEMRVSIVAVYDAALTASEVLQNYNATKSNYV